MLEMTNCRLKAGDKFVQLAFAMIVDVLPCFSEQPEACDVIVSNIPL